MPKRKKIYKEEGFLEENVQEQILEEPVIEIYEKLKHKKKEFIVRSINKNRVYFRVGKDSLSFTQNIWGDNLRPGDTIYL